MFSEDEIRSTLKDHQVLKKYAHYLDVFGYKEEDKPKDLEEWVRAISEGETKGYSLTCCVLGVIEAAIYSLVTPYDEMMRLANAGVIEKIRNAGLDPTLERKLIEFQEKEDPSVKQPIQQHGLSIEQQFNIRSFETQVDQMSLEQATSLMKQMYKHMVSREAVFKSLLRTMGGSL